LAESRLRVAFDWLDSRECEREIRADKECDEKAKSFFSLKEQHNLKLGDEIA